MRLLIPAALILSFTLPALGSQEPGIVIHPFGAVGCEPMDATRVTNALGAHLSSCVPFRVLASSGHDKLTGLEILSADNPARALSEGDAEEPLFRLTGLVAQSPTGQRIIQVAALRKGEPRFAHGFPVPWPDDTPVPAEALARETVRAMGPLGRVMDVSAGAVARASRSWPPVPPALSLLVRPLTPLPPGEYWLCELAGSRLEAAPTKSWGGPRARRLARAIATVSLSRSVTEEAWVSLTTAVGPVRPGLFLALKTRSPLTWPASCAAVELRSRPPLSFASVGDDLVGVTPCLACLPAGARRVALLHPGFTTKQASVHVTSRRCASLFIALAPRAEGVSPAEAATGSSRLSVRSEPAKADVLLDGKPIGRTPLTLAAAPEGTHEVSVRAEGYQTWRTEVDFPPGKSTDIEVHLARVAREAAEEGARGRRAITAAAGPLAQARNLPLPQRNAPTSEALSLPVLTLKGSPRVRETRVVIAPLSENTVRADVTMDDGLPEGTRVAATPNMVSVVIPDAIALGDKRARRDVQLGGVETVQAGQQSQRNKTVRVQLKLRETATAKIHDDHDNGLINFEVTLPPPGDRAPQRQLELPTGSLWFKYPEPTKRMALTFDDFPSEGVTGELLAVLREHGVPATFFVIGRKAAKTPWLVRQAVAEGHVMGNHTYNHRRLTSLDWTSAYNEIERCSSLIKQITGKRPRYFRPPGGRHNSAVRQIVGDLGMRLVMWKACSNDYEDPPPSKIVHDILKTSRGERDVIVDLHDGHHCTVRAIPELVHELRLRRYRLVTLDELLND